MRRALLIGVFAAFSAAILAGGANDGFAQNPAKSQAQPYVAPRAPLTDMEKSDLQRVSAYLNTIKSVQGRFTQIAADGRTAQGTFYLRKPGRIRFEYDKPNPILIVADGASVAVSNSQLKTTDRYPLINSPLRLLLSESLDLTSDQRITDKPWARHGAASRSSSPIPASSNFGSGKSWTRRAFAPQSRSTTCARTPIFHRPCSSSKT